MIQIGDFRIGKEERKAVKGILDSGRITEGKLTAEFEREWAKYIGTKYCVAVNSGTSALIAVLSILNNGKFTNGVVTSPVTFIATVNAIVLSGFHPYFVDIDSETFCMKTQELSRWPNARIVLPVHLMGYPVEMNKIKKDFIVVEDACQAHGTIYRGKRVGSIGIAGCFSFYIAHNIQCGEMGAITTNNKEIYRLLRQIKAHGRECSCTVCHRETCPVKDHEPRFTHTMIGYNFKTMEFQSAFANIQLKRIGSIIKRRQYNVNYLNRGLSGVKTLKTPRFDERVSYLAYPLLLTQGKREELLRRLETKGIETRPLFSCIPTQQPAYAHLRPYYKGKLPNAEFVGTQGFYLPCHQYLTKENLNYIIKTVKENL